MKKDIIEKLDRFNVLWNESLNGNYENGHELNNLARQIRDAKYNDEFLVSSLTEEQRKTYHFALILANTK